LKEPSILDGRSVTSRKVELQDALDTFIAQFPAVPSPFSVAALEELSGTVTRINEDATA
jgi:hypothetical protein